jgi:hypothetical protein
LKKDLLLRVGEVGCWAALANNKIAGTDRGLRSGSRKEKEPPEGKQPTNQRKKERKKEQETSNKETRGRKTKIMEAKGADYGSRRRGLHLGQQHSVIAQEFDVING